MRNKIGTKGSVNEPFDVKQGAPSQEGKIGLAGRFRMAHAQKNIESGCGGVQNVATCKGGV